MTTPTVPTPEPRVTYSYIRWSHPDQARGDSLRRQTEKAEAYCKRHNLTLDDTLNLKDLGVSAFRGKNALVGNLGVFLEAVRRQTVRPGSYLIVESLDRISRQGIDEGYDVCKRILKAGVHIVTLSPERDFGPEAVKGLTKGALELQLILERAAEESERKSERICDAWSNKRVRVRQGDYILTRNLPRWVREEGGRLVAIPDRAETVRSIFRLAANGYGTQLICQRLNRDKVATFGTERWYTQFLTRLLRDRRVLGEFQPRGRDRVPDGPPIDDYFPRVVSEQEWAAAQDAIERRCRRPRLGDKPPKHRYRPRPRRDRDQTTRSNQINVFQRLVYNARSGDKKECYIAGSGTDRQGRAHRVLIAADSTRGDGPAWTFPLDVFEQAVLSHLKEIDPAELLPRDQGPDPVAVIGGRLAGVRRKIAELEEIQNEMPTAATQRLIAGREAEEKDLVAKLDQARCAAAMPLEGSWGETKSLLETLDSAPDQRDARLRLRAALRRVVQEIRLLVVPEGTTRYAFVRLSFVGGDRLRHYLIRHDPAWSNGRDRRAASWVSVIVTQDVADLTVETVEKILAWSE
jgi:DNA invertase Pin-like site-specific DNA recombinase